MTVPGHPVGYDSSKDVPTSRNDCHITVGFDHQRNHIPRFLVTLHYATAFLPPQWTEIARFDHNEVGSAGHDLYQKGVHIDVSLKTGGEITVHPQHSPLPQNRGKVIRRCVQYLVDHADYFVDIYTGSITGHSPPGWPDGGNLPSGSFIRPKRISRYMSRQPRGDDTATKEELNEILAEATGTTAEAIEQGATDITIEPPEEADVVRRSEE